jgi:hypothetical protein
MLSSPFNASLNDPIEGVLTYDPIVVLGVAAETIVLANTAPVYLSLDSATAPTAETITADNWRSLLTKARSRVTFSRWRSCANASAVIPQAGGIFGMPLAQAAAPGDVIPILIRGVTNLTATQAAIVRYASGSVSLPQFGGLTIGANTDGSPTAHGRLIPIPAAQAIASANVTLARWITVGIWLSAGVADGTTVINAGSNAGDAGRFFFNGFGMSAGQ